jgi:DnaK suppressor protein
MENLTEQERMTVERLLLKAREAALAAIGHFDETTREMRDRAGELSLYRFHPADLGTEMQENEKDFLLASKEGRRLYEIDEALRRLYAEPERFGLCLRCGRPIGFARLEVIPEAPYCAECQALLEAGA